MRYTIFIRDWTQQILPHPVGNKHIRLKRLGVIAIAREHQFGAVMREHGESVEGVVVRDLPGIRAVEIARKNLFPPAAADGKGDLRGTWPGHAEQLRDQRIDGQKDEAIGVGRGGGGTSYGKARWRE